MTGAFGSNLSAMETALNEKESCLSLGKTVLIRASASLDLPEQYWTWPAQIKCGGVANVVTYRKLNNSKRVCSVVLVQCLRLALGKSWSNAFWNPVFT